MADHASRRRWKRIEDDLRFAEMAELLVGSPILPQLARDRLASLIA